jgi:hypothetical protein
MVRKTKMAMILVFPNEIVDVRWVNGQLSIEFGEVFSVTNRNCRWVDGTMVGH